MGARYTPKWTEVVITAMFVALGFAIFGFAARFLPIFPEEKSASAGDAQAARRARGSCGACPCRRLTNPTAGATPTRLGGLGHSISAKLMASIFVAVLLMFALLGYFSIRLHQKHLEAAALISAEQQSEVLRRCASHYMLKNDRVGLYEMMVNMADQPGIVRVRIMNSEGVISYSTLPSEVGGTVNKDAEACYGCHEQSKPLALLKRSDRFRVYRNNKTRVLGIITPIENQPACSNAACHAHPASVQILGVLDTNLSLAKVDVSLAQERHTMLAYTGGALLRGGPAKRTIHLAGRPQSAART